jgi:hypothetical protein
MCVFIQFFLPAFTGDICIPNPCMNGGICQLQSLLSFTCQCRSGFQGFTCQICKYFIKKNLMSWILSAYELYMNIIFPLSRVFFSARRCLYSESMSKWRIMYFWWTNRIISVLLSTWIHRSRLWYRYVFWYDSYVHIARISVYVHVYNYRYCYHCSSSL